MPRGEGTAGSQNSRVQFGCLRISAIVPTARVLSSIDGKPEFAFAPKSVDSDMVLKHRPLSLDVLVYRGYCANQLWLYKNAGDGTFTLIAASPGGYDQIQGLVVADFNCDGKPDVFISRWTNAPDEILINDGKGYFNTPATVGPTAKVLPNYAEPSRGAAAADVDHDGDMDIVIANDVATQDRLYYNNCNDITLPPQCTFDVPSCTMVDSGGHRYAFCNDGRSWQDAENQCKKFGFHLATLNDSTEAAFVKTNAATLSDHAWIGATDLGTEGSWSWPMAPSTYFGWCTNEPNGSTNENCAVMNRTAATSCMSDLNCGSGYRYVC